MQTSSTEPASDPLRILVVDDEQPHLNAIQRVLRHYPFVQVTTTTCGLQAIARASIDRPDGVLVDMNLEGLCGSDVIRTLRKVPELAGLRLAAISASWTDDARRRALKANADLCLEKPLNAEKLLALVAARRTLPAPDPRLLPRLVRWLGMVDFGALGAGAAGRVLWMNPAAEGMLPEVKVGGLVPTRSIPRDRDDGFTLPQWPELRFWLYEEEGGDSFLVVRRWTIREDDAFDVLVKQNHATLEEFRVFYAKHKTGGTDGEVALQLGKKDRTVGNQLKSLRDRLALGSFEELERWARSEVEKTQRARRAQQKSP